MPQNAAQNGGRDRGAVALASGASQAEAAELAGVDRSTVARWLQHDTLFAQQIRDLRKAAFDSAIGVLVLEAENAARHLVQLATGQHDNGPVRLGSIRSLFQIVSDHLSLADLEARLAAVETKLNRSTP